MRITEETHPALWFLLHGDERGAYPPRNMDGTPCLCEDCPFGVLTVPRSEVWNDPSEAYYDCRLIRKRVWGEDPKCILSHWKEKARQELGLEETEWPAPIATQTKS